MAINKHLSIITLSVNGLDVPIKRHRVADWIKKQKHSIRCLQETHLGQRTRRLKLREWEKIFHAKGQDRKAAVEILILDKIDIKIKAIKKTKKDTISSLKDPCKKKILKSSLYMSQILDHPDTSNKY